jgi:hypothetical protein
MKPQYNFRTQKSYFEMCVCVYIYILPTSPVFSISAHLEVSRCAVDVELGCSTQSYLELHSCTLFQDTDPSRSMQHTADTGSAWRLWHQYIVVGGAVFGSAWGSYFRSVALQDQFLLKSVLKLQQQIWIETRVVNQMVKVFVVVLFNFLVLH